MLYETIKALCDSSKITIAQLERETDISNGTISKWQIATPKIDAVAKIANYFKVSLDYLINRDSQKIAIHNNGNSNINLATAGNHNSFFADKPPFTEFETQLLKTYNSLTTPKKMELLTFALKLENKED